MPDAGGVASGERTVARDELALAESAEWGDRFYLRTANLRIHSPAGVSRQMK